VVSYPTSNFTGNFIVNGTVVVSNPQGGSDATISCAITMGGTTSDSSYLFLTPGVDAGGRLGTLAVTTGYSNQSNAGLSMACSSTGGTVNVVSSSLTAVKVASLN
jgi:hypothetical protein